MFVPIFEEAMKNNDMPLLTKLCDFLEQMEASNDVHVQEVVAFTIVEELCDKYDDIELEILFQNLTKKTLREVRTYISGDEYYE